MARTDAPMARTTDPVSSHIANSNIKNNVTLADNIICAVRNIYAQTPGFGVTDDQILEFVEALTQKRQQRNVIARARGLLERDGLLERIPSIDNSRVAVRPNKEWCDLHGYPTESDDHEIYSSNLRSSFASWMHR